ncbi:hypothetical protein BDY24DRAFT_395568 [Mrakia frigida]|uniref:zinc finger MYND domain-containing protein n=1 Tax=Mrakia frigida TaxID=29902 RepID=UPI003FCC0537
MSSTLLPSQPLPPSLSSTMSWLPTSDQMATTLGIKDGSFKRMNDELCQLRLYEGVPPDLPSFPPFLRHFLPGMRQRNDLIESLEHLGDKDATLLPEFAHFWLPQLVEAHSVAVVANFNNPWTRVILLLGVNVNPIFDRYCRSPVEGVALRECFYRLCGAQIEEHTIRLERLWSPHPTTRPQEAESYVLAGNRLQFICNIALTEVVACRPPPSPSHSLSLHLLLSRIQRFLHIIQRSKGNVSPAHEQDLEILTRTGSWTEGLLKGEVDEGALLRVFGDRPWLGCAADTGAGGCHKLEGGSSMKACSRCLSVRYCSVAHQRSHWKEHKKTCWEPIW